MLPILSNALYKTPLQQLGLQPNEAVMIGDDPNDDVNGSMACGLHGILVKTGKYTAGDESKCPNATYHAADFADAVDYSGFQNDNVSRGKCVKNLNYHSKMSCT